MASIPKLEAFLSTIASGITGLALFKDYGIVTPELDFFIRFCTETRISVSALAPSPLIKDYNSSIEAIYSKLVSRLPDIKQSNISEHVLDEALEDAKELHNLLNAVYNTVRVGAIPI